MALFGRLRQARRDEQELGSGVWRRAHDRFHRAVDRYHQVLEGVAEGPELDELIELADSVADLLPRVRAVCVSAQSGAPTDQLDVPAGPWLAVHRELSRAGNSLATAAEALAMFRLGSADVIAVRRRVVQVQEQVTAAENALP